MQDVLKNFNLTGYNTFGIEVFAKLFLTFRNTQELKEVLDEYKNENVLILGGGSNVLFSGNIDGLVLQNKIKGIEVIDENANDIYIRAWAGEVWQDLVDYCVGRNLGGIENLSLIPGNVGASPMQNIGAYGVEVKDVFYQLQALHVREGYIRTFSTDECRFGYRESVFKNQLRGQFVILNVTYRLSRYPRFNISYGMVENQLKLMGVQELSVRAVSEAVIAIRRSKLPDPKFLGNAGSFFKNPVIEKIEFERLKLSYPHMPHYPSGDKIKIPAAWLIEQCGFKGYRRGNVGCHEKQPLVIVNYGGATGKEVFDLSEEIIHKVYDNFGITLVREVNVI